MKEVRVRIAPSPTGDPHVGTAYIALFNYAFAKHHNGKFLLRIEDTDRTRSTKESELQIFESLRWLGLNWDEGPDIGGSCGPYRQSERFDIYKQYAEELVAKGEAYYCFCTADRLDKLRERQKAMKKAPGYDGYCRALSPEDVKAKLEAGESHVIRLKMPYEGDSVVKDGLRGEVRFENSKIDDQILLKSDGFPTYHLANVVDDHLMGITHVIRAEEWIASTPKHIQLYKAFGWDEPEWYHMPLLRNDDRSKISKRKNPVSLIYYREKGYLREAMLNFLALMGWTLGDGKEIFTLEDMIKGFSFEKVSLGGPVFDLKKLGWLNASYIKSKELSEIVDMALPYLKSAGYVSETPSEKEMENVTKIVKIAREPAETLSDIPTHAKVYFADEFELPQASEEMSDKEKKHIEKMYATLQSETAKKAIELFSSKINSCSEEIAEEKAKEILHSVMEEIGEGPGKVLMPLRLVLTGESKGPDLYTIIHIIGKARVLKRVENTVKKI